MKKLFEEYGDVIIVIIAITALVAVVTTVIKSPVIQQQFTNLLQNFFTGVTPPA